MRVPWEKVNNYKVELYYRIWFTSHGFPIRRMKCDDLDWEDDFSFIWLEDRRKIESVLQRYKELRLAAGLELERVWVRAHEDNVFWSPSLVDMEVEW